MITHPLPHHFPITVAYADTDAGGVTYHARYIEMAERARMAMLKAIGHPVKKLMAEEQGIFIVKKLWIDYIKPAELESDLTIITMTEKTGSSYITLKQTISHDKIPLAQLEVLLVFIDTATKKPKRIPQDLIEIFKG